MAFSRFLICERLSWQRTIMPVGMCMTCTAESVVLTPWPPGPLARQTSMRSSSGLMTRSTSCASGRTATVAVEVWMRPCASVAGTRWTRWTPLSKRRVLKTSSPLTWKMISLKPPRSEGLMS